MGNFFPKTSKMSQRQDVAANFSEVCLFWKELPPDMVEHVLTFLPLTELVHSCRLVCKEWRDIIDQQSFWKTKCERQNEIVIPNIPLEYLDFKMLLFKNPFGRNLVKNWNAEEGNGVLHWHHKHGDYRVECPPSGSDPIPKEAECSKCIAMSYTTFSASQLIDLTVEGCSRRILDEVSPDINVSVWVAARFDCGIRYHWMVRLRDTNMKVMDEHDVIHTEEQWAGHAWTKLQDVFTGYGPGVRYVEFISVGKDTQFWAGFYGPKIAAPSVRLSCNKHEL